MANMNRHEATFTIESKNEAYVVRRLLEQVYDSLREESRATLTDDAPSDMLQQFATLRDAARHQAPGKLTVVYERHEGSFDT